MKINKNLTDADIAQAIDNFKYMLKCAFEVIAPVIIVWSLIFCFAICVL